MTDPQTPTPPAPPRANPGALAKATLAVGITAAGFAMVMTPLAEQSVGNYIGGLTAAVFATVYGAGPIAQMIDQRFKMGSAEWDRFSMTSLGRKLTTVAVGNRANLIGTSIVGLAAVFAARPLGAEGPEAANVALAMGGASIYVTAHAVLRRLRQAHQRQTETGETKPPSPRMK